MRTALHMNAMNYPLPLVRDNSIVKRNRLFGGYALSTNFGPEWDGYRTVFFGGDLEDLLRRLGEAGKVTEHAHGYWYIYYCDACKDTREGEPFEGMPTRCGECA